jgi:hypothetical protein
VVSGPDGEFRIPRLRPGRYGLKIGDAADEARTIRSFREMDSRISKGGEAREEAPELAANSRYAPKTVDHVEAGAEGVEIRLVRDLRIRGALVDAKGVPFRPGVELKLYVVPSDGDFRGSGHGFEGAAEADGSFSTGPLDPAGSYDVFFFWEGGRGSGAARGVRAGTSDARIRVTTGRELRGVVLDESGAPVGAGVPVEGMATGLTEGAPGGFVHTETAADGTFSLRDLGEMSVLLHAGGGVSAYRRTPGRGEFLPGESGVEIAVLRGAVLSGRLVDAEGAVHVSAGSGPTFPVATDGTFRIGGLAPGKVSLRAWVGDRDVALGSFDAPGEGLEIRARR